MNIQTQISKLWKYLSIPDDTLLIIPVYNPQTKRDEYVVAEKSEVNFKIMKYSANPAESLTKPFIMFQQRNKNKQFIIPNSDCIKYDKINDY